MSSGVQWTPDCQWAFELLKSLFAKELVLRHPDPSKLFVVQADASEVAVGAVLLQANEKEALQPCAYMAKKLNDTECNWPIWEKEVLFLAASFLEHPFERKRRVKCGGHC